MWKGRYRSALLSHGEKARKWCKGFTLIELAVTVAVVGILAAIAYPSYMDSVRKSRRTDAKSALLEVAHLEERFSTENNQYTSVLGNPVNPVGCVGAACSGLGYNATTTDGFYTLQLTTTVTNNRNVTYTVTATPIAGKSQEKDTVCGATAAAHFSLNNQGIKCVQNGAHCSNGSASDKAAVAVCW